MIPNYIIVNEKSEIVDRCKTEDEAIASLISYKLLNKMEYHKFDLNDPKKIIDKYKL